MVKTILHFCVRIFLVLYLHIFCEYNSTKLYAFVGTMLLSYKLSYVSLCIYNLSALYSIVFSFVHHVTFLN